MPLVDWTPERLAAMEAAQAAVPRSNVGDILNFHNMLFKVRELDTHGYRIGQHPRLFFLPTLFQGLAVVHGAHSRPARWYERILYRILNKE